MNVQFHTVKSKEPERESGVRIPYGPAKRKQAQLRWYLIVLIVSSPLLWLLGNIALSFFLIEAQGFVALESVPLNCAATGIVENLSVGVGDNVCAGDPVTTLYSPDLATQKKLLQAELALFEKHGMGEFTQKKDLLKKQIAVAEETAAYYKDKLLTVRFLLSQGAATAAELEVAKEAFSKASMDLIKARFELADFFDRHSHIGIQAVNFGPEVKKRNILAQIDALNEQHSRLAQKSPYDGRILDIFTMKGEFVTPGTPLCLLGRTDKPGVTAYLNPRYASYAQKGKKATVTLPDGEKIDAVVCKNSSVTKRLPADLSSPLGSRDMMLLVDLDFIHPVPPVQWVEGLPVTVRFHFNQ